MVAPEGSPMSGRGRNYETQSVRNGGSARSTTFRLRRVSTGGYSFFFDAFFWK